MLGNFRNNFFIKLMGTIVEKIINFEVQNNHRFRPCILIENFLEIVVAKYLKIGPR